MGNRANFNPDSYLQEKTQSAGFNPDQYLSEKSSVPQTVDSLYKKDFGSLVQPESFGSAPEDNQEKLRFLKHAVNTTTLGYQPQLTGLIKTGSASSPEYIKERDAQIADLAKASSGAKYGGMALGLIPGLLAGGAGAAEEVVAPLLSKVISGATVGGVIGAATNPGDEPGKLNPIQAGARVKNAIVRGGIGAAIPLAGGLLKGKTVAATEEAPANAGGSNSPTNPLAKGSLPELKTIERLKSNLKDLENPILPEQEAMYTDPQSRDLIKSYRNMTGPGPAELQQHELAQKSEAIKKLGDTIGSISKDVHPDSTSRGEHALDLISSTRDMNRANAGPVFQQLKGLETNPIEDSNDLVNKISNRLGLQKHLTEAASSDEPGAVMAKRLGPYSRKMGISPQVHKTINDVIDTVNKEPLSIDELQKIRASIKSEINPSTMSNADMSQLNGIRSAMLDHIQDVADREAPGLDAKELMKAYAQNEGAQDEFEKMFGGKIDDRYQLTKNVPPEKVMDKMFANSNNVKVSRNFLGPNFESVKANYVQHLMDKASPKDIFSAQKMASLLEKNDAAISEAFKNNPQQLQRIKDLSDFIRLVPDASPINPSGTAKTYTNMGLLKNVGSAIMSPSSIPGKLMNAAGQAAENRGLLNRVEQIKKGVPPTR